MLRIRRHVLVIVLIGFAVIGTQGQAASLVDCKAIISSENDLLAFVSKPKSIQYHVYRSSLYLMDLETQEYCVLLEGNINGVFWNPDTTFLDLRCGDGPYSDPCRIKVDGTGFQTLDFGCFSFYRYPKWSPDDSEVVYLCRDSLWTENENRPILYQDVSGFDWSPDGTRIVISTPYVSFSRDVYSPDLIVIDPSSATPHRGAKTLLRLTNNDIADTQPDWSPDAKYIAFISTRNDVDTLFIITQDGGQETQITPPTMMASRPEWSSDAKRIFFNCDHQVCFYDLHTQHIQAIAEVSFDSTCDGWQQSPDGTHILYLYDDNLYYHNLLDGDMQPIAIDDVRVCDFAFRPRNQ